MMNTRNDNIVQILHDWFYENRERLMVAHIEASFESTPTADKALISFEKEGKFVATIEAWSNGEADFTLMPLMKADSNVEFDHAHELTEKSVRDFAEKCLQHIEHFEASDAGNGESRGHFPS